jgi:cobaltochelatase CobT
MEPTGSPRAEEIARWRGNLDALAVRARYSDRRYFERHQPAAGPGRLLFSMLEQNRVERLGSQHYAGMWSNLAAFAEERWVRARPEAVIRGANADWVETYALIARLPLGAPLPETALRSLSSTWRVWMTPEQARLLELLAECVNNQAAFSQRALQIVAEVIEPDRASLRFHRNPGKGHEDDGADARASAKAIQTRSEESAAVPPRSDALLEGRPDPAAAESLAGERTELSRSSSDEYRIFTTAYDSERLADELYDGATLVRLREELDKRIGEPASSLNRWAHRLQRTLLSLKLRSWQFDQEDGVLDVSRLTRLLTHPFEPVIYKREREAEFPESVVTVLVDNSRSMLGQPIATAAACAELLGRVLERCSVNTEILGFTTRDWRGGRPCRQWMGSGRPPKPGRLGELQHVVYKNADEPWRRARRRMGVMLADDLLKENVDGEALLWAYKRLRRRRESRKLLLVISDGAPMDEATINANDPEYLDRHLRSVISEIERCPDVELIAIGVGHDVTRYYRQSVTLSGTETLGEAMVTQLVNLFVRSTAGGRSRPRNVTEAVS